MDRERKVEEEPKRNANESAVCLTSFKDTKADLHHKERYPMPMVEPTVLVWLLQKHPHAAT
eukprot:3368336-Pleurochrysis_carterae.AAC.3